MEGKVSPLVRSAPSSTYKGTFEPKPQTFIGLNDMIQSLSSFPEMARWIWLFFCLLLILVVFAQVNALKKLKYKLNPNN